MGSGDSHSLGIAIGGRTEEIRMRRAKEGICDTMAEVDEQMWLNVLDVAWRARIDKAVAAELVNDPTAAHAQLTRADQM